MISVSSEKTERDIPTDQHQFQKKLGVKGRISPPPPTFYFFSFSFSKKMFSEKLSVGGSFTPNSVLCESDTVRHRMVLNLLLRGLANVRHG